MSRTARHATTAYEALLAHEPESEMAANNLAILLVTYRQDRQSLVRALALAARFSSSERAAFLDTLGWVRFKYGDAQSAGELLARAIERAPDEAVFHYHLGMVLRSIGDLDRARKHLGIAVQSEQAFRGIEQVQTAFSALPDAERGPDRRSS